MDCSEEPRGIFLVIDNKSFYATVECTMRGLDPLTTPLVVMSEAENTNGGLVLASSPMAKKLYGISNVNRQRDLPRDNHLIVVPPRMNTYIEKNIEVNNIYREFVADEDLLPYSIDESILNITHSWKLFGDDPIAVVKKIQKTVHDRLKLVTTVGVGENPLQAKIALDVYAKHDPRFIGEITYDTVKEKIWSIPEITDVWGINERTAKRLAGLGMLSWLMPIRSFSRKRWALSARSCMPLPGESTAPTSLRKSCQKTRAWAIHRFCHAIIQKPRRLKSSFEKSAHR